MFHCIVSFAYNSVSYFVSVTNLLNCLCHKLCYSAVSAYSMYYAYLPCSLAVLGLNQLTLTFVTSLKPLVDL